MRNQDGIHVDDAREREYPESEQQLPSAQAAVEDHGASKLVGSGDVVRAPLRSVERQEEIVSILYRFVEAQKANPPDLTYHSARDGNKRHTIYSPAIEPALEQIMALFGYAVTPIE